MRAVFVLCLLVVTLLSLVSCCEETQYLKNGKCCKKCGPGKRMLVDDNCEDPRCQDCQNGEYQSGYTTQTKCERQPYCDPNSHFQPQQDKPSTTSLSKCVCEPGRYCTKDDDCITCMEHTVCKPGERVAEKGSPVSDTVCIPCDHGTFSTEDSADTCKEWTKCGHGYDPNTPGSSTSDQTCLGTPNHRVFTGVGVAVLVFIAIIVLVGFFLLKKRNKGWKELPIVNPNVKILNMIKKPQDADVERADRPFQPLQHPEEDVDHSIPQSPTPSNMTENGNVVDQEQGKEHIISCTESNSYS